MKDVQNRERTAPAKPLVAIGELITSATKITGQTKLISAPVVEEGNRNKI